MIEINGRPCFTCSHTSGDVDLYGKVEGYPDTRLAHTVKKAVELLGVPSNFFDSDNECLNPIFLLSKKFDSDY
jgi:hypothetical protein